MIKGLGTYINASSTTISPFINSYSNKLNLSTFEDRIKINIRVLISFIITTTSQIDCVSIHMTR